MDGHSPCIFDLINSPSPFPPRFKETKNAELRSRVNSFAMRRFGETSHRRPSSRQIEHAENMEEHGIPCLCLVSELIGFVEKE